MLSDKIVLGQKQNLDAQKLLPIHIFTQKLVIFNIAKKKCDFKSFEKHGPQNLKNSLLYRQSDLQADYKQKKNKAKCEKTGTKNTQTSWSSRNQEVHKTQRI